MGQPVEGREDDVAPAPAEPATRSVPAITLQFHPNWPHHGGTVIESMLRDGYYRSQFATGVSNGGLTAYVDGDRWRWESRLFSGRYDDGPATGRPVYGAWNRRADPYVVRSDSDRPIFACGPKR